MQASKLKEFIRSNKIALLFIAKFVSIYFLCNVLYSGYIQFNYPIADPYTVTITKQVSYLLNIAGQGTQTIVSTDSPSVGLKKVGKSGVDVFEGCNGVNVMIVFISFILAFTNSRRKMWVYLLLGLTGIYLLNLVRVMLLFEIAIHYPQHLYLFHKYILTSFLYTFVFIIWYYWSSPLLARDER